VPREPSEPLGVHLEVDRMCGPGSKTERAGSDQYPPLEGGSGTPTPHGNLMDDQAPSASDPTFRTGKPDPGLP
jgi:hypothetical protein